MLPLLLTICLFIAFIAGAEYYMGKSRKWGENKRFFEKIN